MTTPPYEGSEINPAPETYIEPGCVPLDGAPDPDELWLQANHDPMFFEGLMAKWGYTRHAWKAMNAPTPIKPFIPPRPIPPYIGLNSTSGDFVGIPAPEFNAPENWTS
jgi:hypothetical protein